METQELSQRSSEEAHENEGFLNRKRKIYRETPRVSKILIWSLCFSNILLIGIFVEPMLSLHRSTIRNANIPQQQSLSTDPLFFAPILRGLDTSKHTMRMAGSLFAPEPRSLGRMGPGPETDKLWEQRYGKPLLFVLSKEDVLRMGKDPSTARRLPHNEWGYGDEAYIGSLDTLHQIHCLDSLRRAAFMTYGGGHPVLPNNDTYPWVHLTHCVDTLLQNLECNANNDMLTFQTIEGFPMWPDFNVQHSCRNFDSLLTWANTNTIDIEKFKVWQRKPLAKDIQVWPAPWLGHGDTEIGVRLAEDIDFTSIDCL